MPHIPPFDESTCHATLVSTHILVKRHKASVNGHFSETLILTLCSYHLKRSTKSQGVIHPYKEGQIWRVIANVNLIDIRNKSSSADILKRKPLLRFLYQIQDFGAQTEANMGSGCSSVGRMVTFDNRGPWFESGHGQTFLYRTNYVKQAKIQK